MLLLLRCICAVSAQERPLASSMCYTVVTLRVYSVMLPMWVKIGKIILFSKGPPRIIIIDIVIAINTRKYRDLFLSPYRTSLVYMHRIKINYLYCHTLCTQFLATRLCAMAVQDMKNVQYVTLEHKTNLKSLGYICSNNQQYIVWVKMIDFSFMPKIIRILS